MSKQIQDALAKLDPKNDNHWTTDGLPRLDTVKQMSGDNSLTRETLTRVAPELTRSNAKQLPTTTSDAKGEGKPNTGSAPKTEARQESSNHGAGAGGPQGAGGPTADVGETSKPADATRPAGPKVESSAEQGSEEKKPNDLRGIYTPSRGIDAEGNVRGIVDNDAPSVARQPGATAPEHVPQAANLTLNQPENGDEQAEGTDGTSVHAANLGPSNAPEAEGTEEQQGQDADGNVGSQAYSDLEQAVQAANQELDRAKEKREQAVKALDAAKVARASQQEHPSQVIRSWLDRQNEIRTERGRAQQVLRQQGVDTAELRKVMQGQDPIDAQRARKPGFGS